MAVPSKEEIMAALQVPEVGRIDPKSRRYIRHDIITPAQRSQRNKFKSGLNLHIEKHLSKKKMPKGSKWDR